MRRKSALIGLSVAIVFALTAVYADVFKTVHGSTPTIAKYCGDEATYAKSYHNNMDAIDNGAHQADDVNFTASFKLNGVVKDLHYSLPLIDEVNSAYCTNQTLLGSVDMAGASIYAQSSVHVETVGPYYGEEADSC